MTDSYRVDKASQLPGDVLHEIFLSLRGSLEDVGQESNLPWIHSTTHVCRAWRRLAISSPLLWTHVVLQSPHISSIFLDRSADLPLDVVGDIEFYEGDEICAEMKMESIVTCAARIGSLDLKIPEIVMDVLPRGIITSFPRLVKLSIEMYEDGSTMLSLPPFIGSLDILPRLRELRTFALDLYEVDPLISSGLRKLELGGFGVDLTFHEFMDTLEKLSGGPLEELSLWAGIPFPEVMSDGDSDNATSDLQNPSRSISLPHLRVLHLDGDDGSCGALLQHLVIPASITLNLTFQSNLDTEGLPRTLAEAGRALLGPPLQRRLTQGVSALHMMLYNQHAENFAISGWKTQPSMSQFFTLLTIGVSNGYRPPTPSFYIGLLEYDVDIVIAALSSGLQLHTVKLLSFEQCAYANNLPKAMRIASLLGLLRQLASVEILSVSTLPSRILPEALSLANGGYDNRVLPLLRVLSIGTPSNFQASPDEFSSLIESLRARAHLGHRLGSLRLPYSYSYTFGELDIAGLQDCAETVYWHQAGSADVVLGAQ